MAIVNGDNEYASEFLEFGFEKKLTFGRNEQLTMSLPAGKAGNEQVTKDGLKFEVEGRMFEPKLYGKHTVMNLLCVITIARSLNIDWETIQKAVNNLHGAPGRVEFIAEAEQAGLQVIVDYAFEPVALQGLYSIVEILAPKRVIHVLGGTGGGRDTARRGVMGKMAGEKADIVIVTNEDPYDEDPMEIMRAVATGTKNAGKTLNENLWEILDRKEAIRKAVALARPGDLVLVTGKGSEQAMCLAGEKKIPWDDRLVVRDVLNNS